MRTTIGKHTLSAMLLSVLFYGTGLGAEARTEPNSVTFEMGTEESAWHQEGQADADPWQPTHVAVMPLNRSDCFLWCPYSFEPRLRSQAVDFIRDLVNKGGLSKEQALFVGSFEKRPLNDNRTFIWTWIDPDEIHNRPRQVLLYAMSTDDAKKMAQAYWDLADARYRTIVQDKKEAIQRGLVRVENDRKRLVELDDIIEKAPVEFEELKKGVTYHDANQAQRYVDLTETIRKAPGERQKVRQDLSHTESGIRAHERQLAEMIPPAIPGGKVFIHKVRIAKDQP